MATLYVTEYIDWDVNSPKEPPIAQQTISFSTSTQCSAAFNAQTRLVRIHTDAICSIRFGANPTAVTTDKRMAADATEYFAVEGGMKVAAVTNT